jgi:hypothetical protein
MSDASTSSTPARWFFGIFAAFAVFAVVGVYSSRMAYNTTGYDDDQATERYAKLAKLQAADTKTLTTAGWVDQDKGVVRIPIDEAMTEEVDTLKAKPVQAGIAIPGAAAPAANTLPATNTPPADGMAPAPTAAGKSGATSPATKASTTAPTTPTTTSK